MGQESRRVFRVHLSTLPQGIRMEGTLLIRGWLSIDPEVYVRLSESAESGRRGFTNQSEHDEAPTPIERERRIEAYEANEMLEKAVVAITKNRYRAKVDSLLWELDEYLGPFDGTYLASAPLEPGESFVKPAWIADEVTDNESWSELSMARAGHAPE